MRILLTSNASYLPPRGGSTRSNLAWLRYLAAQGHVCRVVSASLDEDREGADSGVFVRSVRDLARRTAELAREIREFRPDFVLVSSEDLGHSLLREAFAALTPERIVYLAHTPQFFPFGPESWNPDPAAEALVRDARAVVVIGQHMAGYVREHLLRDAAVIHPPIYGTPPYRVCGAFDNELALMINPCAVKGLPIFLGLADHFPSVRFAALRGWGTTRADIDAMAQHANVRLLENVADIEEVLARARVLLMPSLWYEGFGLIAMEAMLRGLPVIASDSGGLAEAKRGTGYIVPVTPIRQWQPVFDEAHMPEAVIEPQDIEPWCRRLRELLEDRSAWEREAGRSREAGLAFVSQLDAADFERFLLGLETARHRNHRRLRILLAHNSFYYPSHGGGDRSNRLLMEALAGLGHEVRVVARIEKFGEEEHRRYLGQLAERGVAVEAEHDGAVILRLNGVAVHTLTRNPQVRAYFAAQAVHFDPDVILCSTDDPAHLLLDVALRAPRARVVYLVRATIAAPFGPDASSPNAARTAALRKVDGIVGVSEYVARYVREHGGANAIHLPISLLEAGEPPDLGRFDAPYVTLANPCAVKGIDVLLGMAARMPHIAFAAVPTWGSTAEDLARLRAHANITIVPAADDIDVILRQTRVLLVPSVWAEARSRIVPEAMARGVPVMASDLGGLPEAKMGVPYTLPVAPLRRYRAAVDENMVPVAEVPPQDVTPWVEALDRLTSDRAHWEDVARRSRLAALDYLRRIGPEPFETFLRDIVSKPKRSGGPGPASGVAALSDERRRLLALRLRQKTRPAAAADAWLPQCRPAALRLICFPFAGGGTLPYRRWQDAAGAGVAVCPVQLPGREMRASEPPLRRMEDIVSALRDGLGALDGPFVLFGHSMGAGIAFELARALRRAGRRMPDLLVLSGARAPQFRENRRGEPVRDTELGTPELWADPDWRNLVAPAMRADLQMYRDHIFSSDETPLAVPIAAYGGSGDDKVRPEHLEGWRVHTSAGFIRREFPGGHIEYLLANGPEIVAAIFEDLAATRPTP